MAKKWVVPTDPATSVVQNSSGTSEDIASSGLTGTLGTTIHVPYSMSADLSGGTGDATLTIEYSTDGGSGWTIAATLSVSAPSTGTSSDTATVFLGSVDRADLQVKSKCSLVTTGSVTSSASISNWRVGTDVALGGVIA